MSTSRRGIIGGGFIQRTRPGAVPEAGPDPSNMTFETTPVFQVGANRSGALTFQAASTFSVGADRAGTMTFQASFTLNIA